MDARNVWLLLGMFLTALAVLLLELLDSRLLSVLTWYHISFMAVSLAMLGAAAGAVLVFLNFRRLEALGPPRALYLLTLVFALSIPATHLILKEVQIPTIIALTWKNILPLASTVVILALPFLLSGAAITVGLTMVGGRIGLIYGADLLGASAGCLLIVPLLQHLDMASALFVVAAIAAAGSACFARFHGAGRDRVLAGTAILLFALGLGHAWLGAPLEMSAEARAMYTSKWNAYSHVLIGERAKGPPFYWGRGAVAEQPKLESIPMVIDRNAATPMTGWDGDPASLSWVQYDVTALPYHLRNGSVAIIGVGGGRDILAAIWGRSTSITAIEYNEIFVRLLRESHREFTQLADFEGVTLVNDEGRAYLTRSPERFDVIQMSLVDTMAATGAGAFTLSENGLYTVEAWRLFLDRLKPTGVLSTSRWFSPSKISETSRLLALCVTVQLERGARDPADHIALITRGHVATLLTSPEPFLADDVNTMMELAGNLQFDVVAIPGHPPADLQLARILSSSSLEELRQAVAHPHFDLTAPTDSRPISSI